MVSSAIGRTIAAEATHEPYRTIWMTLIDEMRVCWELRLIYARTNRATICIGSM